MIYNQIVTWTAFAILAMFFNPNGVKCARGEGAISVFSLQLLQALVHSGNDWSLLMINKGSPRIFLLIIRWLLLPLIL